MTDSTTKSDVLQWFDRFAQCVRAQDLAGAESLFEPNVVAFGTRNEKLLGFDALREKQWQPTWSATRDFRFLPETIHVEVSKSGDSAWAHCLWTSCGDPGDRPPFERRGRATFVLVRHDGWKCVHSHLSMTPSGDL